MYVQDNQISVTCKHEPFKGNVPSQAVDSAEDHLVASASLASVNLAGYANHTTRCVKTMNCSLIVLTLSKMQ